LAPEDCVENASDALIDELEALSVSVEDADADSDAEQALFGEPGMRTVAGLIGWGKRVKKPLEATRRTLKEDALWRRNVSLDRRERQGRTEAPAHDRAGDRIPAHPARPIAG